MLAVAFATVIFFAWAVFDYAYTHDPATTPSPKCFFRLLTGWDCPGCGSQRAAYAMLHGRVADAWRLNPFIFFAVPVAVFYLVVEAGRRKWPGLHSRATHPLAIVAILLAIIAWWIGRNL